MMKPASCSAVVRPTSPITKAVPPGIWLFRKSAVARAEVLEHALSDRLLDAIDDRLGRPVTDPHGDAIPAADGSVVPRAGITVDRADPGLVGVVLRVSDRDPVVLRGLARDGIGPGTELEVREPGRVRLPGGDIRPLSDAEAASIWLTVPSVVE